MRRRARVAPARPHAEDDEEELIEDTGLVARFLTNRSPAAAVFLVAALVGARDALGHVSGWALTGSRRHGRLVAAAPAELARRRPGQRAAGTAVRRCAGAALGQPSPGGPPPSCPALLLLAVPIAWWGAWRFLRPGFAARARVRPLAAALGFHHLRPGAGHERARGARVGRHRAGGGAPALAGPCRARPSTPSRTGAAGGRRAGLLLALTAAAFAPALVAGRRRWGWPCSRSSSGGAGSRRPALGARPQW
ncbi:MAG: hypothetical protein R2734_05275 [Nocardioides sp.]